MAGFDLWKTLQLDRPLLAVALNPKSDELVAVAGGRPDTTADGLITIAAYADGQTVTQLVGHTPMTRTLAFAPNGAILASGGRDGTARLWRIDSPDGKPFAEIRHGFPVLGVAFSPDGKWLATASGDPTAPGQSGLFTTDTGRFIRPFEGHRSGIYSVAFSPDGELVASSGIDATIRVHEVATGRSVFVLEGHAAPCWTVAWRSDGAQLASGSHDHTIKLWSAASGTLEHTLEGHDDFVAMVRYQPDTSLLVSASNDGNLRFWDSFRGVARGAGPIGTKFWGIDFNASGNLLAVARLDMRVNVFKFD